jgi:hypothetical protein
MKCHNIHLLTGYEGNSTFIVPKVLTIVRGNAEDNSWYREDECKIVLEYSECYIVYESDIVHDCDIILEYG